MLARKLMGGAGAEEKLYVDDVFSTYLYTGNSSAQVINNGIDLAGEGGLVWIKSRSGPFPVNEHILCDTIKGPAYWLSSNTTSAYSIGGPAVSSFSSSGFGVFGGNDSTNYSGNYYASWTFRKAPKFFDVQTATLGTGNATVSFSGLSTLGMVIVKRTDSTGDWYVWHRSLTAGKLMYLNKTAAEATLGHITVSGTTLTLVDGTLADGNYICYAFAHDTGTDGIIQCGSFSGNAITTLGWEPQYIMYKRTDSTSNWTVVDSMRGIPTGTSDQELYPNLSNAEATSSSDYITLNATGFTTTNLTGTFIYIAIRRPNKPPTSGTKVFEPLYVPTERTAGVYGSVHVVDLYIGKRTNADYSARCFDRLRGGNIQLGTAITNVESSMDAITFDTAVGVKVSAAGATSYTPGNSYTGVDYLFRRAPGFFDVVCYTGAGSARTVAHSLGVAPELIIVKDRINTRNWTVYYGVNTAGLFLNLTNVPTTGAYWNNTSPTASVFSVSTTNVNEALATYVAYLFSTLAGISKVGSYTGNGSSQTINCGFSAGARFILIKRTDSSGDWYVWDSVRGIVAANDPHLSLNTANTEVTTDDSVDPDNSGFIVNQVTATNINVTSATYIFLAIA